MQNTIRAKIVDLTDESSSTLSVDASDLTAASSSSSSSPQGVTIDLSNDCEDHSIESTPLYKKVTPSKLYQCLKELSLVLKSGFYPILKPADENADFLLFHLSQLLYPNTIRPYKNHSSRAMANYCRIELSTGLIREDILAMERGQAKNTPYTKKTSVTLSTADVTRMPVFHQHQTHSVILGFDLDQLKLKKDSRGNERYVWLQNANSNSRPWYVEKKPRSLSPDKKSIRLETLRQTSLTTSLQALRAKLESQGHWGSHNEILACLQKQAIVGVLYQPGLTTATLAMCAKLEILHCLAIDVPVAEIGPNIDGTGLTMVNEMQILSGILYQLSHFQAPPVNIEWAPLVHLQLHASKKSLDYDHLPTQVDFDKAILAVKLYQRLVDLPVLSFNLARSLRYVDGPFSPENITHLKTRLDDLWVKWLKFLPHKIADHLQQPNAEHTPFNIVEKDWAGKIISDFLSCLSPTPATISVSGCQYWAMQNYLKNAKKIPAHGLDIDTDIIDCLSSLCDEQRCKDLLNALSVYANDSHYSVQRIQDILEYACVKLASLPQKTEVYLFYLQLLTRADRADLFKAIKPEHLQELSHLKIYSNDIAWIQVYRNGFGPESVMTNTVKLKNTSTMISLLKILSFLSQHTTHHFGGAMDLFFQCVSLPYESTASAAVQNAIDYKLKLVATTGCIDLIEKVIASITVLPCAVADQARIEQCMNLACLIVDSARQYKINCRHLDYLKLLTFTYGKGWLNSNTAAELLRQVMSTPRLEKIDYNLIISCFENNLCSDDDLLALIQTGEALFLHNLINCLLQSLTLVSAEYVSQLLGLEEQDLAGRFSTLQQLAKTEDDRTVGNQLLNLATPQAVSMFKLGLNLEFKRKALVSNVLVNVDQLTAELGEGEKPMHWNATQLLRSQQHPSHQQQYQENCKIIQAVAARLQTKFKTQYPPLNLNHALREQFLLRLPIAILQILDANTARACRNKQQLADIAENYSRLAPDYARGLMAIGHDSTLNQLLEQRFSLPFLLMADTCLIRSQRQNCHEKWQEQEESKKQYITHIIRLLRDDGTHPKKLVVLPCMLAEITHTSVDTESISIDSQHLSTQLSRLSYSECKKIYLLYKLQNKMAAVLDLPENEIILLKVFLLSKTSAWKKELLNSLLSGCANTIAATLRAMRSQYSLERLDHAVEFITNLNSHAASQKDRFVAGVGKIIATSQLDERGKASLNTLVKLIDDSDYQVDLATITQESIIAKIQTMDEDRAIPAIQFVLRNTTRKKPTLRKSPSKRAKYVVGSIGVIDPSDAVVSTATGSARSISAIGGADCMIEHSQHSPSSTSFSGTLSSPASSRLGFLPIPEDGSPSSSSFSSTFPSPASSRSGFLSVSTDGSPSSSSFSSTFSSPANSRSGFLSASTDGSPSSTSLSSTLCSRSNHLNPGLGLESMSLFSQAMKSASYGPNQKRKLDPPHSISKSG